VVDLPAALRRALPRASFEEAVALLDWTIKTGRFSPFDVQEFVLSLSRKHQRIGEWVDPSCDSFLESVVRTRLRLAGHQVTSQVPVAELGSIDLVVDGVVAIETDGYEYHSTTFESDRSKDLAILAEGRTAMRLSYRMVRNEWSSVETAVEVARSSHRLQHSPAISKSAFGPRTVGPGWRLARTRRHGAVRPAGSAGTAGPSGSAGTAGPAGSPGSAGSAGMQATSGRLPFL
jgi:very-short-patch-repair endonuclease